MDRNIVLPKKLDRPPPSLSARRAWIEIVRLCRYRKADQVALRKESVDRNVEAVEGNGVCDVALRKESVDRNKKACADNGTTPVALRKESVDRNNSVV